MSYSPVLGRFIQRDPIGYLDGANVYQYEKGEANGGTDAFGLAVRLPSWLPQPPRPDDFRYSWYQRQVSRLYDAFRDLCSQQRVSSSGCPTCSPRQCQDQASEFAQAIALAVLGQLQAGRGGPGGWLGNFQHGIGLGVNNCGDWQSAIARVLAALQSQYRTQPGREPCFSVDLANGTRFWLNQHHWIEISIGGSRVVIDPWPSGGEDIVDDQSAWGWPSFEPLYAVQNRE